RQLAAAPLLGRPAPYPVKGQIPGDLGEEHSQDAGPLGRHGVPGPQPGVVDAFLGVLVVFENAACDGVTVRPVLGVGLDNGLVGPLPVERYNLLVVHVDPPLSPLPPALAAGAPTDPLAA